MSHTSLGNVLYFSVDDHYIVGDGSTSALGIINPDYSGQIVINETIKGCQVKEISKNAFAYCSKITRVIIRAKIESIGHNAFIGCKSLEYINIPPTCTYIGRGAFISISSTKLVIEFEAGRTASIGFEAFAFVSIESYEIIYRSTIQPYAKSTSEKVFSSIPTSICALSSFKFCNEVYTTTDMSKCPVPPPRRSPPIICNTRILRNRNIDIGISFMSIIITFST